MAEEAKQPESAAQPAAPARAPGTPAAAGGEAIKVEEAKAPARATLPSLADVEQEVERAFERFFKGGWLRPGQWDLSALPSFPSLRESFEGKTPRVNVIDRDSEVVVEAELPGVQKSDIEVSLGESTLTIKASTRRESEEEKGEYRRREISTGYFSRTVTLPGVIDGGNARAAFENGLLTVTIPKSEASKRRTVAIE